MGADLANVQTKAVLDGDEWVLTGQKVWTSLAHWADWCFVVCRTDPAAPKHKGTRWCFCPMRQAGVEIRPIIQLTGTSEFSEVFFDGARAARDDVVGEVNGGWRVAMGLLGFERVASARSACSSASSVSCSRRHGARENGAVNGTTR